MNPQKRVLGNGTVRQARRSYWRISAVAAIVGGLLACNVYADNTNWTKIPNTTACGGACTSAEVILFFSVSPSDCVPSCTVTPTVASPTGLCSPIESIMMHIIDPGDPCAIDDTGDALFPIDLQAGPFVFTNAQFLDWSAEKYTADVVLTAPTVCSSTEDPPGSGIMKVCATAADCDGGDTCDPSGTLKAAKKEKKAGPVPTLSEWGVAVMTILLLSAGTIVFRRQGAQAI